MQCINHLRSFQLFLDKDQDCQWLLLCTPYQHFFYNFLPILSASDIPTFFPVALTQLCSLLAHLRFFLLNSLSTASVNSFCRSQLQYHFLGETFHNFPHQAKFSLIYSPKKIFIPLLCGTYCNYNMNIICMIIRCM